MKIYHYTKFEKWNKLDQQYQANKSDHTISLEPRSLQSLHGEVMDERAITRATFGLLEPVPQEWTENKFFPTLWDYFVGTRGDLLLEIDIAEDDPNVLVGDAGFIEGFLYREHQKELNIPPEYYTEDPQVAFNRYQKSLITLAEYDVRKPKYLVPEVQIRENVHLDRVRISHIQPILEKELGLGIIPDGSIHPIPWIHKFRKDLGPWLNRFELRNTHLKSILDGIDVRTKQMFTSEYKG